MYILNTFVHKVINKPIDTLNGLLIYWWTIEMSIIFKKIGG